MRTHPHLKSFFAPLIALASLTLTTAPAQVSGGGQSKSSGVVALPDDVSQSALAPRVTQPKGMSAELVSNRKQKRSIASGATTPSAISFLPAVTYASGGYDLSLVVADVNGDGKPDVLVSDYDGGLDVLLSNGDGTFKTAAIYSSAGTAAVSIAVADVNRDGKLDVAVTNFYSDTVAVLLGNGDGTFQAAVTYGTAVSGGSNPDSVAVADVNGDGNRDLVITNSSGNFASKQVCVLLGKGDGTFLPAVGYSSGGEVPESVVVADVNGDGKPDLLVANFWASFQDPGHGSVGVLLGNGDGSFQEPVAYLTGGAWTVSLAVADINGDGKPDLIAGNSNQGTVGVLLGNGDGSFQPAVTYSLGGLAGGSMKVVDIDGDGKPDLVAASCSFGIHVSCPSAVGVLFGNGQGTFQPVTTYGSGGYGATSVAVADVNGDLRPDLLVATCADAPCSLGAVGVLLNNTKSATSTSLSSSLNPSTYGQKVTWTATVTSSGSVAPTGTVRFTWSGNTIGSATLNSSGVATLTRSNLIAATYPLKAVYAGDAANLGSTSTIVNQMVLETTSKATLTSSPNPSTQGQAVTFTAKITSPTVIPTGPVTFIAGTTVLGTAQLGGGKAKLVISSLPVGSTKVTVKYNGDSNIAKSSASVTQTVH